MNPLNAFRIWNLYRDMMRAARLSRTELDQLRQKRLRRLVRHAYDTVPYYRRLFDEAGIKPAQIQFPEDLVHVPVTSKQDLRRLPIGDVVSSMVPPDRLRAFTTSGSTGEPFVYYRGAHWQMYLLAARYRSMIMSGLRWTDRLLCISQIFHVQGTVPQRFGLLPTQMISTLAPLEQQLDALLTFRPTVILGYPSSLRPLALAVLGRGLKVSGIRRIFTSSELLDRSTTALIVRVFGAEPFSLYGTLELARFGWQCRVGGPFHTADDHVITEIVRDEQPLADGETGEVVVTHLFCREAPLIRYRLGDLGRRVSRTCACRHAFDQIDLAGGRVSEVLVLPDGTLRSPLQLTAHIHGLKGVAQYQLRQDDFTTVTIKVVAGDGFRDDTLEAVRRKIEPLLPGLRVVARRVDEIPRIGSGKHSYIGMAPEVRAEARARLNSGNKLT